MISIGRSVRLVWRRFQPQHQWLVVIMVWPLLYYLKQGQDVFQWSALLQYGLLLYLLVLASRQEGWEVLGAGRSKPIWILFCCFVLYITLVSLVNSPIFLNGIVGWIKHVQFVPLLLVCSAIGPKPDLLRRWFIPYLFVLFIFAALPVLLSAISESSRLTPLLYTGPGLKYPGLYVRYKFVFNSPNTLAVFLANAIVFCFFSLSPQLRRARVAIPVLGMSLLGVYLVLLTLSRRTWVILPVVLVLGIGLQRGLRRRVWLVLGVGLLFVFVLYLLLMASVDEWGPMVKRWSNLLVFKDGDSLQRTGPLHLRLILYERIIGYLQRPVEWVFGLGAGTIGFAVRNYLSSGYATVDGYYAILLGEYGSIGLLLYLALVVVILSRLARAILQRRLPLDDEGIVVACLTSSLLVLLAGVVGNSNTVFPNGLYMWSFLGIGLNLCERAGRTQA